MTHLFKDIKKGKYLDVDTRPECIITKERIAQEKKNIRWLAKLEKMKPGRG